MAFYEFDQNNSGGHFEVDDSICHRLFVEAKNFEDAVNEAELLGCYWDRVANGFDCPCCGDRWYKVENIVDIERLSTKGYEVTFYGDSEIEAKEGWFRKYGKYEVVNEPQMVEGGYYRHCSGEIKFNNIEEYMQYLADEYGWTSPDARIFYMNGDVKEIFGRKVE